MEERESAGLLCWLLLRGWAAASAYGGGIDELGAALTPGH